MIESIELINVEGQRKRTVKFDPEVTCLVGPSNAGKSTTLRALLWTLMNDPSRGTSMIRHGKKAAVSKVIIDGRLVVRKRSKSKNHYSLDGKPFRAFLHDVPVDIASLANTDAVNFQSQHDGLFWFSDSAGKVSRELNRVVSLEEIDAVLSFASHQTKAAAQNLVITRQRVKEAKEELAKLAWVPAMVKSLEELRARDREIVKASTRLEELSILVTDARKAERRSKTLSDVLRARNSLVASGNDIVARQKRIESIASLVHRIKHEEAKFQRIPPSITYLERQVQELKSAEARVIQLDGWVTRYKAEAGLWEKARREGTRLRKQLEEETGGTCPVCGGRLPRS